MHLRRSSGTAACLGVFACFGGRAAAHEPVYGTGVYARGAQLVVRNSRGLVVSRSGERQAFRFLCNEALHVAEYDAPSVILREDQSLLIGSSVGLWHVSRDLCAIARNEALSDVRVNALRQDPHDSAHIYAATDLGLYESRDQGESFTQLDPHAFDSLEVPASTRDLVYAAGKLASTAGQAQAYFAHWQPDAFALQQFALDNNEYGVELLGSDAERVFAVAHAYLGTQYLDRLLVSVDGAHSWHNPLSAPSISAFLVDAASGGGLLGNADGLWRLSDATAPTMQLQPAAVSCLARASQRLYMCDGAGAEAGVSASSDDGQQWQSVLRWNQVSGLADCPSDTPAVSLCQVAWEDWQREMPAGPPLSETNTLEALADAGAQPTLSPAPKGCAAVSGTRSRKLNWLWLALCIFPTRTLRRLRTPTTAMNRTLHYAFFVLLLLSACTKSSGGSHMGSANGDGGSVQDAGSPTSPNMLADASVDAATSGAAGSGGEGGKAQSGSGGQRAAAGNSASGGHSGSASAGHSAPITQDAGPNPDPDTDSGPGMPQALCTTCGACEETQKVVSTMHTTNPVQYKDPPPTSGPHNPCWGRWGVHDTPLAADRWVHNLEHGGVVFLYNCPAGCDAEIAMFKTIASTRSRTIVTSYADLPKRFGVVSWGHRLVSECMDAQAFMDFLNKNFDHGPESNANPPNPTCPP